MQDTGPDTEPQHGNPDPRRRRLGRMGFLVAAAGFVAIWGYVMYLTVFEGRAEPRDRLDDTAWTASAEQTCAATRAELDPLPYANEVDSLAERAELLDAATDELEVMVRRLDGLPPPAVPAEARAVDRWLVDYREYLENRRDYADRFRQGLDEPFRVTDRGGFQIDLIIDDFARINHMESCETPDDVG